MNATVDTRTKERLFTRIAWLWIATLVLSVASTCILEVASTGFAPLYALASLISASCLITLLSYRAYHC